MAVVLSETGETQIENERTKGRITEMCIIVGWESPSGEGGN